MAGKHLVPLQAHRNGSQRSVAAKPRPAGRSQLDSASREASILQEEMRDYINESDEFHHLAEYRHSKGNPTILQFHAEFNENALRLTHC